MLAGAVLLSESESPEAFAAGARRLVTATVMTVRQRLGQGQSIAPLAPRTTA